MKTKKIALLAPVILTAFLSTAYVSADETNSVSTPDVVLNQTPDQSTVAASVNSTDVSTVAVETSPVIETTSKVEVNTPNQVSVSNANPVSTPAQEVSAQQKPSEALSQTSAKTYQAARGGDDTKQESNAPVTADLVDNQLVVNYKPTIAPDEQVKFAVWSQINGQDDLVWYDSSATGAAYIDLSKHRSYGVYNVHTYAFKENTPPRGISALTVTLPEPKVETTISQETSNTYAVTVKNVPSSIDSIMVPVWSAKDGQDDIKWYQASQVNASTYSVIVPLSEHHFDMGYYDVHVYGHSKVTGGLVGLAVTGGFNHQDKRENAKIAVVDYAENKTQFDVVVSSNTNTKPIKSVSIAVWSEAKGQDDLKWYTPSVTNNQARVTIDIANHSNTSDKYNVHVYTDYADGSRVGQILGAYQITKAVANPVEEKEATVKVSRYDKDKGQLDVTVSQGDKEVKYVRVAAWSEDKQSNLHWYVTKDLQNGQATVTVDQTNHKGLSGSYVVHTYVDYADGSTKGFVVGQYELAKKEVVSATVDYKGTGVYGLSVTGVKPNIEVLYAVWSDTKGQDDLKWYTASSSNNRAAGLINVENHTGLGLYNVHVYQKNNGTMTFLTATTFNVSQDNFTTPYYNQRDPRWASVHYGPYQFGPTGCVPTSLAMVFSSLKNTKILPTTVGDYLYNETIEFNRGGEGTTGQGILKASQKWGVKANVLNSQDEIISALQEGHHVLAAIQHNKFVIHGTHELVLKGYSNGLTYVRDPYMSSNSGWYPVSALWNEQSTDRGDIEGLGRPFVKITDI